MPNRDGSGPLGQGAGTGRLGGGCAAGRGNNRYNHPGRGLGCKNGSCSSSQNGGRGRRLYPVNNPSDK